MSALAKKVAPPKEKSPIGTIVMGVVLSLVGGFVVGMLFTGIFDPSPSLGGMVTVFTTILIAAKFTQIVRREFNFNKNEFPAQYESWKRSFHCGRCGEVFEGAV